MLQPAIGYRVRRLETITTMQAFRFLPLALALGCATASASDWLVLSGASYHFRDREDYRADNPGVGWERREDLIPVTWMAGYYRNSYDRDTFYAGGRWEPLDFGALKLGVFVGLASGYWTPVVALPMASVEYKRVGFNIVALPNIRDYAGYLGLQVKFKLN